MVLPTRASVPNSLARRRMVAAPIVDDLLRPFRRELTQMVAQTMECWATGRAIDGELAFERHIGGRDLGVRAGGVAAGVPNQRPLALGMTDVELVWADQIRARWSWLVGKDHRRSRVHSPSRCTWRARARRRCRRATAPTRSLSLRRNYRSGRPRSSSFRARALPPLCPCSNRRRGRPSGPLKRRNRSRNCSIRSRVRSTTRRA